MKRTYQAPMASVETFGATDSYCATCYYLACDVTAANNVERANGTYNDDSRKGTLLYHDAAACGAAVSQVINDTTGAIYEASTSLGNLPCSFAPGTSIYGGAYVEWTTSADTRVWHHQGYVGTVDSKHPNRS